MNDMKWIPVTDALPIKSGVYLVCNAHGTVFTAMRNGKSIPDKTLVGAT